MKTSFLVTGLMSGSSLDGVDMALCNFNIEDSNWTYEIISAETISYPENLRVDLVNAIHLTDDRIIELDIDLARFYADELNLFHSKNKKIPDLISSHGHTVFHKPQDGVTLQIGNGRIMAEKTGITVINNFRQKDVEHGGQGAPLVPVGDRLLFGDFDVCLNIGGIANLSYEEGGCRIAYDICVANMALNYLSEKLGKSYDNDGEIASSGKCNAQLLNSLNGLNFYLTRPPKSLGREWFESELVPILEHSGVSVIDLIATTTEHIAQQIGQVLKKIKPESILVTGGGVLNRFLMDRIRHFSGIEIVLPERNLIEYKESLIFGLLGVLRLKDEINCYATVTGASKDLCSGEIFVP